MPCTPARPDQRFADTAPSQPSAMIAERHLAAHSASAARRRNRLVGNLPSV
jgi:hypothetical protein